MIRHRPAVVAELLSGSLKVELPDWRQVRTDTAELTDLTPVQYRADAVTVFADTRGATVFAVVNEIQLRRDPRKRRTWPHYLTSLHARLGCPTMLLVMCTDMATARWCAAPIEIGHPGWVLRPLVVGPDTIPMITDVTEARRTPELAVLSAIAHGRGPEEEPVFQAMLTALQTVDQDHFELYTDIVLTALPEAARHCLEALMDVATYEFQSDYFRRRLSRSMAEGMAEGMAKGMAEGMAEGRAAGRVEGEARALLAVLSARGIPVPDHARERITRCTDADQLEIWVRRAATADSVSDLFDA